MAYKVFVAGEEALASDVNTLLMGQTVARFPSAAARTSAIASPVLNQLTMLDTRAGVVQYWNGSAWLDTEPLIQSQMGVIKTTQAGGEFPISFPVAYAANPTVVAILQTGGPTPGYVTIPTTYINTTGFTAVVWHVNGTTAGNEGHALGWIAVGVK